MNRLRHFGGVHTLRNEDVNVYREDISLSFVRIAAPNDQEGWAKELIAVKFSPCNQLFHVSWTCANNPPAKKHFEWHISIILLRGSPLYSVKLFGRANEFEPFETSQQLIRNNENNICNFFPFLDIRTVSKPEGSSLAHFYNAAFFETSAAEEFSSVERVFHEAIRGNRLIWINIWFPFNFEEKKN